MTLANGAWLGADVSALAAWFPEHQLADGGWNCEWIEGSTRSSFHSTINALRGILAYEEIAGSTPELRAARKRGEEYLLERRLRYRLSDGEQVTRWATVILWPYRAPFTALKAVDYFTQAARHDGAPLDPRVNETLELVRSRRQPDGTWLQEDIVPGRVWFPLDVPPGEPSKWLPDLSSGPPRPHGQLHRPQRREPTVPSQKEQRSSSGGTSPQYSLSSRWAENERARLIAVGRRASHRARASACRLAGRAFGRRG